MLARTRGGGDEIRRGERARGKVFGRDHADPVTVDVFGDFETVFSKYFAAPLHRASARIQDEHLAPARQRGVQERFQVLVHDLLARARPRLAVYRSNTHIYAQVIDDRAGATLAAASSAEATFAPEGDGKIGAAKAVGKLVAERAKDAGVEKVVFDRGGNRYQGRVAALADSARDAGLKF